MFAFGFINPQRSAGAPALGAVTFTGAGNNTNNNTPNSVLGINIGTADANRWVFACVGTGTAARTFTSVTIQGISALKVADSNNNASSTRSGSIWAAYVPTGTTADVVVNMSGADSIRVALYTVSGNVNIVPFAKDEAGASNGVSPVSLATVAGGVAFGFYVGTSTFTGDFDVQDENGAAITTGATQSSAHKSALTTGTSLSISYTNAASSNASHCFVSLAPAKLNKIFKGNAAINNLATSTRLFTASDIGPARSDRWVIVAVSWRNTTGRTLNSATIGGVTATILDQTTIGSSNGRVAIMFANVPTGTTADINLTFSGVFVADTSNGAGIDWYTVYGNLNTTPTDSYKEETIADPSKTFTVSAGGIVIFIGTANNVGRTVTGSITHDDEFVQYVAGGGRFAGSYQDGGAGGSLVLGGASWSTGGQTCSKLGYSFAGT